jgi:hypothetical protein
MGLLSGRIQAILQLNIRHPLKSWPDLKLESSAKALQTGEPFFLAFGGGPWHLADCMANLKLISRAD